MSDTSKQTAKLNEAPETQPQTAIVSPSKQLGKYKLLESLSESAFCTVYKAEFRGKYYAIKLLKSYLSDEDRNLFEQEAKKLQNLRHQALPKFMELEKSKPEDGFYNAPYLVMEYIEGRTLDKIENVDLDTALGWLYDLARVLAYLHKNQILHNDIKPSNIQVSWSSSRGRSLKLLDLGISSFHNSSIANKYGTVAYMSPERFRGETPTTASDIYSFGLVAYELLSGNYPYDKKGNSKESWEKIHCTATPNVLKRIDLQSKISQLIMRCLDKVPEKRPEINEILETISMQVIGIGQPSYIGIVGSRSSGKTCYLVSLYNEAFCKGTTQEILEPLYINLYQNGVLPKATAKTVSHLEFKLDDYVLVTKDYGGELLKGRRKKEELSQQIQEFTEQQMDEIYEFFENARGILILLETFLEGENLQRLTDCANEIKYLIEQISIRQENKQKFPIPVALVVSKWDRLCYKNGRKDETSLNPEEERQKAIQYLQTSHWKQIYQKFTEICSNLEVFPIYSFIGDTPKTSDIQTFNLCAPLKWLASKAEQCLFERAQNFYQENLENYSIVIENYSRLLTAENILDSNIRKSIQESIQKVSEDYLKHLEEEEPQYKLRPDIMLSKYNELLQTRGIYSEVKNKAQQYVKSLAKRNIKQWSIVSAVAVVLLFFGIYFIYENLKAQNLSTTIDQIDISTTSSNLLQTIEVYGDHATYNPLRRFVFASSIKKRIASHCEDVLKQELRALKQSETTPVPENKKYNQYDQAFLLEDITNAERNIDTINKIESRCVQWQTFQNSWSSVVANADVEECQLILQRIRSLKEQWFVYRDQLKVFHNCFLEWEKEKPVIAQLQKEKIWSFPVSGSEMHNIIENHLNEIQQNLQSVSHLLQFFQQHQLHNCPIQEECKKWIEIYTNYRTKNMQQEDILREVQNSYIYYVPIVQNAIELCKTTITSFVQYKEIATQRIIKVQNELQEQKEKLEKLFAKSEIQQYSTLYDVLERHIRYINTLQDKVKLYENDIEKQLVQFTEQKRKEADEAIAEYTTRLQRLNESAPTETTGTTLQEWKQTLESLLLPENDDKDNERKSQIHSLIQKLQEKLFAYEKYWLIAQNALEDPNKYYIHENQTEERIKFNIDKLQSYDIQAQKRIQHLTEYTEKYPGHFVRIIELQKEHLEHNRKEIAQQLEFGKEQLQQFVLNDMKQKINQIEEAANYQLQNETDLNKRKAIIDRIKKELQDIPLPEKFSENDKETLAQRQNEILALLQNYYIQGIKNMLLSLDENSNLILQEDYTLETLQNFKQTIQSINQQVKQIEITKEDFSDNYQEFEDIKTKIFNKLNEQDVLCDCYIVIQSMKKYMQKVINNTNIEASPENLTLANEQLNKAKSDIAAWKLSEQFTEEHLQKIRSAIYDFQKALEVRIKENETEKTKLELLAQSLESMTLENLRKKIQMNHNYSNVIYEIEQNQKKIENYPAFQRKYSPALTEVISIIKAMREQDILDYEKIRKQLKNAEILNAYNAIQQYKLAQNHEHICDINIFASIEKYSVSLRFGVIPQENFDDGGDIPTFCIYIQQQLIKENKNTLLPVELPTEQPIQQPAEQETLYINDVIKLQKNAPEMQETTFYEGTFEFSLTTNNIFNLHIWEIDWISNEDYGSHNINMNEILNNQKIIQSIECTESNSEKADGVLKIQFVPTSIEPLHIEPWSERD